MTPHLCRGESQAKPLSKRLLDSSTGTDRCGGQQASKRAHQFCNCDCCGRTFLDAILQGSNKKVSFTRLTFTDPIEISIVRMTESGIMDAYLETKLSTSAESSNLFDAVLCRTNGKRNFISPVVDTVKTTLDHHMKTAEVQAL